MNRGKMFRSAYWRAVRRRRLYAGMGVWLRVAVSHA